MRSFTVKINGKVYNAEVEETTQGAQPKVTVSAPKVSSAPTPAAPVITPPVAPVAAAPATAPEGGVVTNAPMPGTVLKLCVASGTNVKVGQAIIVLEAMKMENEIVASVDGVVTISVNSGASVSTGDVLFSIN